MPSTIISILTAAVIAAVMLGSAEGGYEGSQHGTVGPSEDHPPAQNAVIGGFWKKHVEWKPRLVQEWRQVKVWKSMWKTVWGPVQIQEWLPIPKRPPPGWNSKH